MADYQSLLTRAVANLPNMSSAAMRQAIYDRARKALLTQLRTLRPPLPESDIAREEKALDQAIALVEAKFGATDPVPSEPAPATTATPTAGPSGGAGSTGSAAPRTGPAIRPSSSTSPSAQAATIAPERTAPPPIPQRQPAARPPEQQTPPRPAPARPIAPASAAQNLNAAPARPAPTFRSGANVPETRAVQGAATPKAPPVRADRPPHPEDISGAAAPTVAARTEQPIPATSNLAKVVPSAEANTGQFGAPPVVSRIEDETEFSAAPAVPIDDDRLGSGLRPELEGQRPQAPAPATEKSRSWLWLALAVVLGVVLSVAGAAIVMRQKPQDLAIAPPEPQQEAAPQPPAKIAQRAQTSPTEDNSSAPATSEAQAGQSTAQGGQEPANATPDAGNAALPGAARAAMLIASPDNPQKPVVNLGSTVWSTVPPAPGQPATVAVKADADIPDLKMHATMTLRKNTDPTLQATHTIDLKFAFADGAPIAGFKDVGAPQMRKIDSTASEALTSVKVKISDVYFLIALAKGDQDTARNLDLMQTRAWFDFPLLLDDNRIAKLVFQKSSEGEAMLAKAFEAWK
jgi:hypothetical protein